MKVTLCRPDVGEIRNPLLVLPGSGKLAIKHIVCDDRVFALILGTPRRLTVRRPGTRIKRSIQRKSQAMLGQHIAPDAQGSIDRKRPVKAGNGWPGPLVLSSIGG